MKKFAPFLLAAALLIPAFASAQAVQCQLPNNGGTPMMPSAGDCTSAGGSVISTLPAGNSGGSGTAGSTALPAPNIAYAQSYVTTFIDFINWPLVPLLIAVAFIVFLWGVANAYILHPGDEEAHRKGHQYILWGIIGFVIIFSVWGLVNLVSNTLGLGAGSGHPPYPTL